MTVFATQWSEAYKSQFESDLVDQFYKTGSIQDFEKIEEYHRVKYHGTVSISGFIGDILAFSAINGVVLKDQNLIVNKYLREADRSNRAMVYYNAAIAATQNNGVEFVQKFFGQMTNESDKLGSNFICDAYANAAFVGSNNKDVNQESLQANESQLIGLLPILISRPEYLELKCSHYTDKGWDSKQPIRDLLMIHSPEVYRQLLVLQKNGPKLLGSPPARNTGASACKEAEIRAYLKHAEFEADKLGTKIRYGFSNRNEDCSFQGWIRKTENGYELINVATPSMGGTRTFPYKSLNEGVSKVMQTQEVRLEKQIAQKIEQTPNNEPGMIGKNPFAAR